MANWVEDFYLVNAAQEFADALLTMLEGAGIEVDIPGYSDHLDVDAFRESIWADAGEYLAMNPALLEEEYNEIMGAAAKLVGEDKARAYLNSANAILADGWDGDAADEFAFQMDYIKSFMDQQQLYIATSAQAVAMMYAVSVRFRESFHSLLIQTTSVCRSIIMKQGNSNPNWKSLFVDIVDGVIDVVSAKAPVELVKWAVDKVLSETKEGFDDKPVEGADELAVVNGYADARDRLRDSHENNLRTIQNWVDDRRGELEGLKMTLREPLEKSITDVDSPDFRYENFYYADHDPSIYVPEVERERQKYVDEKPKPGGLISERLAGK